MEAAGGSMTFFIEISRDYGFNWRPGFHRGPVMRRCWWGWFAFGVITSPFDKFTTTAYDWEES